jgi:F-type H+-transporting ATPase subunit a
MVVIVLMFWAVTRRIKLIPSRLQNLLEFMIEYMYDFCEDVAGKEYGRKFFPIVMTILLYILVNAWMSLIPGYGSIVAYIGGGHEAHAVHLLRGANTDINLPLALALISFVFVEYHGIRALGRSYFKKFFNVGPLFGGLKKLFSGKMRPGCGGVFMGLIAIFVGVLEGLSELVRVLSFTFRLFGNMTGGEILILMMFFLAPWVLALPFYGFEMLVGVVQAIVFAGLTLVFATTAVTPHELEETGEGAH